MTIQDQINYLATLSDSALLLKSHKEAAKLFYKWIRENIEKPAIKSFTQQHKLDLRKPSHRLILALRVATYFQANPIYKEAPESQPVTKEITTVAPDEPAHLMESALSTGATINTELATIVTQKAEQLLKSAIQINFRQTLEAQLTKALESALSLHIIESKQATLKLLESSKQNLLAALT